MALINTNKSDISKTLTNLLSLLEDVGERFIGKQVDTFVSWAHNRFLPDQSRKALASLEKRVDQLKKRFQGIDEAGLGMIAEFEAFRSRIYKDVAGHPTIGYGHLIRPGEKAQFAEGLSQEQGMALLKKDVALAVKAIKDLVTVDLNQNQLNALTSFVFNVGRDNFAKSTLLKKLNKGQYDQVAKELNRWVHAKGKVIDGLVSRRAEEADLFYESV